MYPRHIEDERTYGARSVHVVLVFPNPGGWGQATALRLQLEASAAKMFDIATFGSVYVRAVSGAYMVRAWRVAALPCAPPCYFSVQCSGLHAQKAATSFLTQPLPCPACFPHRPC